MHGPGKTLSIVIASCNQLNSLKFTLLALRDQMPDIPTEIIVVDNASSDGTAQFLVGQGENGALRVLINTENLGRTRARNEGAKASKGRFIMFLNPGIIPGPGWWSSLLSTLQMDPHVGAVTGKIIIPDGRIDHAGLAVLEWGGAKGGRLSGRSINAGRVAGIGVADKSLHVQGLAGEALMVRATAFFSAGGFNPYLGTGHHVDKPLAEAEPAGLDFSLRLKERGWNCIFRTESVMTRLRLTESSPTTNSSASVPVDAANLTDYWLGRVRPDFIVVPGEGATPTSNGIIRPYVEPVLTFANKSRGGMVNPNTRKTPTASIIVVTQNALSYTRRCVDSLLAHTGRRHELILVDNASTDSTTDYLLELEERYNHIQVIHNDKNLGFAGGCNVGLSASEGDHVVLLNNDVVVTDGWLDKLLDAAEKNPRVGILGPVTNTGAGIQRVPLVDYNEMDLKNLGGFAGSMGIEHQGEVNKTTRLAGFCLMIKRELLSRIGGLDERFGKGKFEDNDYCLRAMAAGYEALIVRSCFVHHFGSKSFEAAGVDLDKHIMGQWDIFKAKWGIPLEVGFSDPVDMRDIMGAGFSVTKHFCALPDGFGMANTMPEFQSQSRETNVFTPRETLGTVL